MMPAKTLLLLTFTVLLTPRLHAGATTDGSTGPRRSLSDALLAPQCGVASALSSFLLVGKGGTALEPGGWNALWQSPLTLP